MKILGIRDVIGPIMVGPSSSHTAGALRIALMCRRLLAGEPRRATFTLYGSFAHTYRGHGTDKALVAGLLGMGTDDLRIRDSFELAQDAGLTFEFVAAPEGACEHPNTVDIDVVDETGGATSMRGESIGGGAAVISRINGVDVRLTGEYHSIVVKQRDVKGVLAHIATCLNIFDINIATTRLFRERKGDIAYTIMQTDDEVDEAIARAIANNPAIYDVRIVKSDRASGAVPPVPADAVCALDGFGADLTPETAAELFETLDFPDAKSLLAYCERERTGIGAAMCRRERCMLAAEHIAVDDTRRYLAEALDVMRESAARPLDEPHASMGGLIGGEAAKLSAREEEGPCGPLLARAVTYAMAVLETNASMGRIVAAPTAGSSGVVPALLLACQDVHGFSDAELIDALANAAAVGYLITRNATVSGAEGGCQAEVGAASAMAASAACQLFGGNPRQCLNAAANAIAGLLGLVCDPIAGLVEAPCQKRNATGVANALVSAQIALAGIGNLVDFDQTVEAMHHVGRSLPFELRESALGGLAATPAACAFCQGCGQR
ncbi:MAG: L-serine ammonia-lyase, iron-sulfur-dependent, subunit alpha [Slackia sp.]|nr:L-serine ammonia-lyase, iron-sulfur-dependent, subunit alpha [Slackia sp.]